MTDGLKRDSRLRFAVDQAGRPCFWAGEGGAAAAAAAAAAAQSSQAASGHSATPMPTIVAPLGAAAPLTDAGIIAYHEASCITYAEVNGLVGDTGGSAGLAPPTQPPAAVCAAAYRRPSSLTLITTPLSDGYAGSSWAESRGSGYCDEGAEEQGAFSTAADGCVAGSYITSAAQGSFEVRRSCESGAAPAASGEAERGGADGPAGLVDFFARACGAARSEGAQDRGTVLADRDGAAGMPEAALLGHLCPGDGEAPGGEGREVYLNTNEPFCLATVGVQGGGKSHTLACVLEACLVPLPQAGVVRLRSPMAALVLHYDHNPASVCEATGLGAPDPALARLLAAGGGGGSAASPLCYLPRERLVVLVSPTYYRQRRAFYSDYCTVRPLLFRWHTLSADHLKRIMRVRAGDGQLYVAAMLDLLRRYQRDGVAPTFAAFLADVKRVCKVQGQAGPLEQRLALLESLVAESEGNRALAAEGADLRSACAPGTLVVADLTDPLLASDEANAVFQAPAPPLAARAGCLRRRAGKAKRSGVLSISATAPPPPRAPARTCS